MFGVTRTQRTIDRSDFHLPVDVAPDDRSTRTLSVEAIIALPELAAGSATPQTIAPTFKHMQIAGPGAQPVCRLRLEMRVPRAPRNGARRRTPWTVANRGFSTVQRLFKVEKAFDVEIGKCEARRVATQRRDGPCMICTGRDDY
jgi:hypothetical protein